MRTNILRKTVLAAIVTVAAIGVEAQEKAPAVSLFLNEGITTFLIAEEDITMVDLSAPDSVVVANQATDNIVRMKALREMREGEKIGVATVIGERNLVQYNLYYTADKTRATTEYRIMQWELGGYLNPAVDMDIRTMYSYAWKVWDSRRRFYDVSSRGDRMTIRLNNLYSAGGFFFFDISIENRTKVPFDIEDVVVKLCDKKQTKSTNYQEIDIKPELTLMDTRSFKKTYRNVFVIRKLTFPDEKVLTFTFREDPISGRTITLKVNYTDVLNADSFSNNLAN